MIVFVAVTARNEWIRPKSPQSPAQIAVGKTVALPGVQFEEGRESLILALSTTCHFCKDSLPFYKALTAKAQGHLDVIAVFPQTEAEGEKYLHDAGVSVNQFVSTQLDTLGVVGTPTLLLVSSGGKIEKVWAGFLDQTRQQDVLTQLVAQKWPTNALSSLFKHDQ